MEIEPYISFCIPTNGVIEWVVPVIESIYSQNCDENQFEVIVTDNGSNTDFCNIMMEYTDRHDNFIYEKTEAIMFLNQIESFKLARGQLLKFINHRMPLLPGALKYFISFVRQNISDKPVVYFSNGSLKKRNKVEECNSFDEFVREMSYWSSWSAGTAVWKKDFDKLDLSMTFNKLFPHTDLVFSNKKHYRYVVDDTVLLDTLPTDDTVKGSYDLFNAFAVEYPDVVHQLYVNRYISKDTFDTVKKQNGFFVSELYWNYVIRKKPCSYKLDGYMNAVGKYYSNAEIKRGIIVFFVKKVINRFRRIAPR